MSWNGSNKATPTAGKRPASTRSSLNTHRSSLKHGAIAGLAVVALGGAAVWWFFGRTPAPAHGTTHKAPSTIAEATPEIVTNKVVEGETKPELKDYDDMTREEKLKYWRDKYGDNIPDNIKPTVYYLEHPPAQSFHPMKSRASIFKLRSDRAIATLLLMKPGAYMLRCPSYDERFDEQFKKSLEEEITIDKDDSAEDKELKQAVIDTRKELAERMKGGEPPSSIMNSEFEAMYSLGQYKKNLQKQLREISRDESYTDQDIADFVTAANEMLTQKGIPAFKMPNLIARQIEMELSSKGKKKIKADTVTSKKKEN